ncbi:DUF444 family protein [bacterium]|nr:DUF444 family protein [bacterium]
MQADKDTSNKEEEELSPEQSAIRNQEKNFEGCHEITMTPDIEMESTSDQLYSNNDLNVLQNITLTPSPLLWLKSLDELLERDKRRQEDGFPRKIHIGRLVRPGKSGEQKVVVVPSTVEEKLMHDRIRPQDDESEGSGGAGDGEEGEVIGEQPVRQQGEGQGGAGQGKGGEHEAGSDAYELGKILTEKFKLPNLKEKGKKRSLTRFTYDLTDRNRGTGQILDKKATLRKIITTNIALGRLKITEPPDPTRFLVAPQDKVYRILSREKDYESQAMVFFVRDYSGSMSGNPTKLIVTQHVLIYSWLLYQYANQVETRFILHDVEAKEVEDFYTYYNTNVAGGTQVSAAYKLVNKIVNDENLAKDYNIYVFHGTDGDDWDAEGKETIPELKKLLTYINRIGVTIARPGYARGRESEVQKYLDKSGLLKDAAHLLRMDVLEDDSDEERIIESIRRLIGEG